MSKRWRQDTPTLADEPTHFTDGTPFFGYYSLGHEMVKESKRRVEVVKHGLRQYSMRVTPAHCRVCKLHAGDARLKYACERPQHEVKPTLDTRVLNIEIETEKRASQVLPRMEFDGSRLTTLGAKRAVERGAVE